ncbi:MAG: NAD-dependent epimerase/dehydratase family protein [Alphaproteobacteria bacterium]
MIALTGATGFIGGYLLRELTAAGYLVRVLLRRPTPLPENCSNALIGDLASPTNMAAALVGVDTIIHSAGLSSQMTGTPEADFRRLNADATGKLARAAERAGVRRFIFLSSVRAQADVSTNQVLTEELPPAPTDPYGRSKLLAEQQLAGGTLDWVALRLPLVFGPGVKGNMARLVELARSPFPLPFGALRAQRSLLSLENLLAAVVLLIEAKEALRRPLIAADPEPVSISEIIAAMRFGLGRRPALMPVPIVALRAAFFATGRQDLYRRLAEPLVASPARLMNLGWAPCSSTRQGLAALLQSNSGATQRPQ